MIYLNVEDLGWRPYITSWLAAKNDPALSKLLWVLIEKYLHTTLERKRLHCIDLVPVDMLSSVRAMTSIFDAFATLENGVSPGEHYTAMVELWLVFSVVWGIGGSLREDGRKKFDVTIRELESRFPPADTVFEYAVDPKARGWVNWESRVGGAYRPPPHTPFFQILVPTVDTVRAKYMLKSLLNVGRHVLLVGSVGVGKTMIASSLLN